MGILAKCKKLKNSEVDECVIGCNNNTDCTNPAYICHLGITFYVDLFLLEFKKTVYRMHV